MIPFNLYTEYFSVYNGVTNKELEKINVKGK